MTAWLRMCKECGVVFDFTKLKEAGDQVNPICQSCVELIRKKKMENKKHYEEWIAKQGGKA